MFTPTSLEVAAPLRAEALSIAKGQARNPAASLLRLASPASQ